MSQPPLTLVFDLDGTLVDTAPDLIRATNHVLSGRGLATVAGDALRLFVSFGARRLITRGLELNDTALPEPEVDALLATFLAYYADNIAAESRPYPSVLDVLDRAAARGVTLAVCTNKREHLSRKLLGELGIAGRFAAICGFDTFPVSKPDPGHLTGTIARAGGVPEHAVMIGDSNTDVATARAAAVPVIGVSFGYTDVPMHALDPDAVIDHYDELEAALARVLA